MGPSGPSIDDDHCELAVWSDAALGPWRFRISELPNIRDLLFLLHLCWNATGIALPLLALSEWHLWGRLCLCCGGSLRDYPKNFSPVANV